MYFIYLSLPYFLIALRSFKKLLNITRYFLSVHSLIIRIKIKNIFHLNVSQDYSTFSHVRAFSLSLSCLNFRTMSLYANLFHTTIASHRWRITRTWVARILYAQGGVRFGARFLETRPERRSGNGLYGGTIRNAGNHGAHRGHTTRTIANARVGFTRGIGNGNSWKRKNI